MYACGVWTIATMNGNELKLLIIGRTILRYTYRLILIKKMKKSKIYKII